MCFLNTSFFGREGDVAVAISGSGNSPNVLKAMETAKRLGVITIGLTGFEGGRLKSMVDYCIVVPSHNMERIEDLHLILNHLFTGLIRNAAKLL
jgi:D-sedoheptulose 7-phosphate isomerase